MSIEELLRSHRDCYSQYHHHKEVMAYSVTVAYIAAVIGAILKADNFLALEESGIILIVIFALTAVASITFIVWQLRNRRSASDIILACTTLLTRHMEESSDLNWLSSPKSHKGMMLPESLVKELKDISRKRKRCRGTGFSEIITYIVLVLWTLGGIVAYLL